jgi:hypothetical protein
VLSLRLRACARAPRGIHLTHQPADATTAFEMLREHSRTDNRKLIDLATAVVDSHRLLFKHPKARTRPSNSARATATNAAHTPAD